MNLNEYQEKCLNTWTDRDHSPAGAPAQSYLTLGLVGESGEVANKIKKRLRGDGVQATREQIAGELGDVLWYVATLAHELGVPLADIAQANIDKLSARKTAGTIKGTGDTR